MLSAEGNRRLLLAVAKDTSIERRSMYCLFATYWYKFLEDITVSLSPAEKQEEVTKIVDKFCNLYEGEGAPGAMLTVLMKQAALELSGHRKPTETSDDDILNQIARLLDGSDKENSTGGLSGDQL